MVEPHSRHAQRGSGAYSGEDEQSLLHLRAMQTFVVIVIVVVAVVAVMFPLFRRQSVPTFPPLEDEPEEVALPDAGEILSEVDTGPPTGVPAGAAAVEAEISRYRVALREGTLCPRCGTANPAGSRFCGECGRRLAAADVTGETAEA